jgi:hypothetical protein
METRERIGANRVGGPEEGRERPKGLKMIDFYHRYLTYRDVGFGRIAALRFAWLVATAAARPIPVRVPARR